MTSGIRRLAVRVLYVIAEHSSVDTRNWGLAMAREVDFVENDWSAVLWALGSTAALWRHSVSQRCAAVLAHRRTCRLSITKAARSVPALLMGLGLAAVVLTGCAVAWSRLIHASWFDPAQTRLADRLLIVVVPEAVYLAGAAALWRQRRSIAVGVLAAGTILMAHAIIHFVSRG